MKTIRVGLHGLILVMADIAGIGVALAASPAFGVPSRAWLQLPLAVVLSIGGFWVWLFSLRMLRLARLQPVGAKELGACLGASLLWTALVIVLLLHYCHLYCLTRDIEILIALAFYQLPVNAAALFGPLFVQQPISGGSTQDGAADGSINSRKAIARLSIALVLVAGLGTWLFIERLRDYLEAERTESTMSDMVGLHEKAMLHQNVTDVVANLRRLDEKYRWYSGGHTPIATLEGEVLARGVRHELHTIVASYGRTAESDIIYHLRDLTGEHLGDDPGPWIKKYGKSEPHLSEQEAQALVARIHRGMTLGEILAAVPHTDAINVEARGGWGYEITLSPEYCVSVRVAIPRAGGSDMDSVINLSPALRDMKTGKRIGPKPEPW